MAISLMIEIAVPLKSDNVMDEVETLAAVKELLANLINVVPGATHNTRIVKGRTDAGQSRSCKPKLAAAE